MSFRTLPLFIDFSISPKHTIYILRRHPPCLAQVALDPVHDVRGLHGLREEIQEGAVGPDEVQHDGVIHQVVLLVLLVRLCS